MRLTLTAFSGSMHLSAINVPIDRNTIVDQRSDTPTLPMDDLLKPLVDMPAGVVDAIAADLREAGARDVLRVADGTTPMTVRLYGILREGGVEVIESEDLPWRRGPVVISFVAASSDEAPDGRLDDWTVTPNPSGMVVVGRISGDVKGRFGDGSVIWTSLITDATLSLEEGVVVTTANSRYLLGRPMRDIGDLAMHA